jgi:hypothetical protein
MNLAAYLAKPVHTLDHWYANTVDRRILKEKADAPAKVKADREKRNRSDGNALSQKVEYYRTLTDQQFQSIDFRFALDISAANAARLCRHLVMFGYAEQVGKTSGNRRKPANIYQWLTRKEVV